jgi:hypothetical protein
VVKEQTRQQEGTRWIEAARSRYNKILTLRHYYMYPKMQNAAMSVQVITNDWLNVN